MADLIERAIDGWADETERDATGTVDGHQLVLAKEEYQHEQRGPTEWRVTVNIDGDTGPLPTEQEGRLTAGEAQELFDELVDEYQLREV